MTDISERRIKPPRIAYSGLNVLAIAITIFVAAPSLYVVAWSFLGTSNVGILGGFTLEWYRNVLFGKDWLASIAYSTVIAVVSSAISTISAVLFFYGNIWFRRSFQITGFALLFGPLFLPTIVYGLALRATFNAQGFPEWLALLVGHTVLSFPIQYFLLESNHDRLQAEWVTSAVSLGATHNEVLLKVIWPLFRFPIALAFGIGILLSFDEIVIATFVIDSPLSTIPKKMWDAIDYSMDPSPAVVGSMVLLATTVSVMILGLLRRWRARETEHVA